MKTLIFGFIGLVTFNLINPAQAATMARVKTDRIESRQAAPGYSSTQTYTGSVMSTNRDGVGLASGLGVTFGFPALTGMFEVGPKGAIQVLLGIPATSPFSIGVGGLYKHTVHEGQGGGLHLGGGLGLGSVAGAFSFAISGVGGFHFGVPGAPRIHVNLDGGITLTVINNATNVAIAPLSPALGVSVIYFFN
jgi:hypothetical protein